MVPKLLTPEQKEHQMRICADTPENIENDPNLLKNVITCDKTWIFQYDPEIKWQSMHWKSLTSLWKKKAWKSKSKFKAMMIVFYDIQGIIYINWVPEGQRVNQVYYKEVLKTLHKRVRWWRPEMWKNGSQILHQNSAPAHNALPVKTFLVKHKIPVMEHPPYSPDLAPCNFLLFPKVKSALKGTWFESVEAVKAKVMQLLNSVSENEMQHCFHEWKICMEQCRDRGGEYIEGKNISNV